MKGHLRGCRSGVSRERSLTIKSRFRIARNKSPPERSRPSQESSKFQTPTSREAPNFNIRDSDPPDLIAAWVLEFIWSLDFGALVLLRTSIAIDSGNKTAATAVRRKSREFTNPDALKYPGMQVSGRVRTSTTCAVKCFYALRGSI
jgi:hypothetical protein